MGTHWSPTQPEPTRAQAQTHTARSQLASNSVQRKMTAYGKVLAQTKRSKYSPICPTNGLDEKLIGLNGKAEAGTAPPSASKPPTRFGALEDTISNILESACDLTHNWVEKFGAAVSGVHRDASGELQRKVMFTPFPGGMFFFKA